MADYKTLYYGLYNKISDAVAILIEAQWDAEDAFADADDSEISLPTPLDEQ